MADPDLRVSNLGVGGEPVGALSNVRLVSLSEAKYLGMVLVENIMEVGGCP